MHIMKDIGEMASAAKKYEQELRRIKFSLREKSFWYPYGTLANFIHLNNLLKGPHRDILQLADNGPVADIGAADGDLAFFLEQKLGLVADVIDFEPTNFNSMQGIRLLKENMQSNIGIYSIDLDKQFELPNKQYGLIFFLGILYHLKNPFYILEALATRTKYCLVSTRIARFAPDGVTQLRNIPMAYLLDSGESNNDPTNFWIFSETGLRRIIDRTGWDLCEWATYGDTQSSNPASNHHDERAFFLLRSRHR